MQYGDVRKVSVLAKQAVNYRVMTFPQLIAEFDRLSYLPESEYLTSQLYYLYNEIKGRADYAASQRPVYQGFNVVKPKERSWAPPQYWE